MPTTLRSLLSIEQYREYFKRTPRPYVASTPQFGIVAISHEGKYGKVLRSSFAEAWTKAKELMDRRDIADVSIFTRNRINPEPAFAYKIMSPAEDWCGRCRRPSLFRIYTHTHPALRDVPVIVPEVRRCYYCGISWDYLSQHMRSNNGD